MANDNRTSRDLQTREKELRVASWQPAQLLPEPNPRDGWVHRWVRISLMGEADSMNPSVRMREGWEPCLASEYPELMLSRDNNSQFKDNIVIGGLMLCKMPVEASEARKKYFENASAQQLQSVDHNFMRENDPRMPLFAERKSKVSFGKG